MDIDIGTEDYFEQYVVIPKPSPVDGRAPVIREVWMHCMMNADPEGVLHTSYSKIRDELAWGIGRRLEKYTKNQCKKTFMALRKEGIVRTQRISSGVTITVVNFKAYQNIDNYKTGVFVAPEAPEAEEAL